MISITEVVESKGYKNFMKYVYGWGASVVLIGALFKIQHFPGASVWLTVGLLTEAMIFFFSAFEPLHEELDWTLVYPELAGLTDDFDEDETQVRRFDRAHDMPQMMGAPGGGAVIGGGGVAASGGETSGVAAGAKGGGGQVIYGGGSPSALLKFDELLEKADIGPEIFDKLGEGLKNLSVTASKLSDMGDAGVATKEFVTKMQSASKSVEQLDQTYAKSGEVLKESIGSLSSAYVNTAQAFTQTNQNLAEAYSSFANRLTEELNTIGQEGNAYTEKLGGLNKNLSALNAVYELQVTNMNGYLDSSKEYFKGIDGMVSNMNQTVEHTIKLNDGVKQLEQNISSLNNIYGNMLSSLNFSK